MQPAAFSPVVSFSVDGRSVFYQPQQPDKYLFDALLGEISDPQCTYEQVLGILQAGEKNAFCINFRYPIPGQIERNFPQLLKNCIYEQHLYDSTVEKSVVSQESKNVFIRTVYPVEPRITITERLFVNHNGSAYLVVERDVADRYRPSPGGRASLHSYRDDNGEACYCGFFFYRDEPSASDLMARIESLDAMVTRMFNSVAPPVFEDTQTYPAYQKRYRGIRD